VSSRSSQGLAVEHLLADVLVDQAAELVPCRRTLPALFPERAQPLNVVFGHNDSGAAGLRLRPPLETVDPEDHGADHEEMDQRLPCQAAHPG